MKYLQRATYAFGLAVLVNTYSLEEPMLTKMIIQIFPVLLIAFGSHGWNDK